MARSINDIQQLILQKVADDPLLSSLDTSSRSSIFGNLIFIVAYAIHTVEKLFDIHRDELFKALYELKPHTARWYRNKALAFMYGFNLYEDSDVFDISNHSRQSLIESKYVKYAAVIESEDQSRLIIKIAGENSSGELSPIPNGSNGTDDVKGSFDYYMNEVRDAGVRLTIINYLPDFLKLNITIKRDALVLNEDGVNILTGAEPVKTAIKEYMKELPFNGELSLQALTDKIQKVDGVLDIVINRATSAWIDAEVNDYGQFEDIYMSQIPVSGYFAVNLDNDDLDTFTQIIFL